MSDTTVTQAQSEPHHKSILGEMVRTRCINDNFAVMVYTVVVMLRGMSNRGFSILCSTPYIDDKNPGITEKKS